MNITTQMEQTLASSDLALLRMLGTVAHENGIRLYLVGGSVRDCLLGLPVADLDLTSETPAEEVAHLFEREAGARARARSQFGTLKLEVERRVVDLATARSERYARPGALPRVMPHTMDEDMARRDFSINAMAVALWPAEWGSLLDPMGGQQDMARRTLRALHEASFRDDATRILRAVRYAVRLGFRMNRQTLRWLRRDLGYLDAISPARLGQELGRLLQESRAAPGLVLGYRLGVLGAIHPALGQPAVAGAIWSAGRRGHDPLATLGALTYPITRQEAEAVSERLALSTRQRRTVEQVQLLKEREQALARPELLPHQVVELVEDATTPAIAAVAVLAASPVARRRLRLYLRSWRSVGPALGGGDLLRLGVPPGPAVGQLLRELRDARLDGRIRSRQTEVAYVRKAAAQARPST